MARRAPAYQFEVKQGDYGSTSIVGKLTDGNGAVDLTAALSVRLLATNLDSGVLEISAAASFVAPRTAGQVTYTFAAGDLDTAGDYKVEWEVTFASGTHTFPNDGYALMKVWPELD